MRDKLSIYVKNMIRWLPNFLRPPLRPVYRCLMSNRAIRNMFIKQASLQECHEYWADPPDLSNPQTNYIQGDEISELVLRIMDEYVERESKVLEIGCNIGRNLNLLNKNGYKELTGVDICGIALELLKTTYNGLSEACELYKSSIEDMITKIPDRAYKVIYTTAVLEHLHIDSEWVFGGMARITDDYLVTIEDELSVSCRTFPRNYREVFEALGMVQMKAINCANIDGLTGSYVARIFRHKNGSNPNV